MTRWIAVALVAGVALRATGRCQAQEPQLSATLTAEAWVSCVAFSRNTVRLCASHSHLIPWVWSKPRSHGGCDQDDARTLSVSGR